MSKRSWQNCIIELFNIDIYRNMLNKYYRKLYAQEIYIYTYVWIYNIHIKIVQKIFKNLLN